MNFNMNGYQEFCDSVEKHCGPTCRSIYEQAYRRSGIRVFTPEAARDLFDRVKGELEITAEAIAVGDLEE